MHEDLQLLVRDINNYDNFNLIGFSLGRFFEKNYF